MSGELGACLLFYLKHFADMETFHDAGWEPPKGIAPDEWKRVCGVIGRAKSQATWLLRRLQVRVMEAIGSKRCYKYDQKQSLTRDWNIQIQLKSETEYRSWMTCGIALDAPEDGDGRLFFYLQPNDQRKGKQGRLMAQLAAAGRRPIAANGKWPAGCVILDQLPVASATTEEFCAEWAERVARESILAHWELLETVGKS